MNNGTKDLLSSERGTFALVVVTLATVMVFVGKITSDQWIELVKWTCTALVMAKTITGVAERRRAPEPEIPEAKVIGTPPPAP